MRMFLLFFKGVADGLSGCVQAGMQCIDRLGVAIREKAFVLSGKARKDINMKGQGDCSKIRKRGNRSHE